MNILNEEIAAIRTTIAVKEKQIKDGVENPILLQGEINVLYKDLEEKLEQIK